MKPTLKLYYRRFFSWAVSVFFVLFLMRLLYGYIGTDSDSISGANTGDYFSNISDLRKNYASEKVGKFSGESVSQVANFAASQKYEKTASVQSKTSDFETDKNAVERTTKNFKAVIQYEKNEGKKGSRELHLLIGVNPILFDSFYTEIRKFGEVRSNEIIKIDKTNEYRTLNAKKVSLEKTLVSLNELKSKGGAISDYVVLNDKILEIETKMQELGVALGNFDSENEFCSVKFSLYEGATKKGISFAHRLKTAFEWTAEYYALLFIGLLIAAGFFYVLLLLIDKLGIAVDEKV